LYLCRTLLFKNHLLKGKEEIRESERGEASLIKNNSLPLVKGKGIKGMGFNKI
jgi:hypothetical protein